MMPVSLDRDIPEASKPRSRPLDNVALPERSMAIPDGKANTQIKSQMRHRAGTKITKKGPTAALDLTKNQI